MWQLFGLQLNPFFPESSFRFSAFAPFLSSSRFPPSFPPRFCFGSVSGERRASSCSLAMAPHGDGPVGPRVCPRGPNGTAGGSALQPGDLPLQLLHPQHGRPEGIFQLRNLNRTKGHLVARQTGQATGSGRDTRGPSPSPRLDQNLSRSGLLCSVGGRAPGPAPPAPGERSWGVRQSPGPHLGTRPRPWPVRGPQCARV